MGSGSAPVRLLQARSSMVPLARVLPRPIRVGTAVSPLPPWRQLPHQHQHRGPSVQLVEVSSGSAQTGAAQVATEERRSPPCKTAKETGSAHRIYSAISGPLRLAERSTAPQTTQTAMTSAARRTTHRPLEASRSTENPARTMASTARNRAKTLWTQRREVELALSPSPTRLSCPSPCLRPPLRPHTAP